MPKSFAETVNDILNEDNIPPKDDTNNTGNVKTLKPGSKHKEEFGIDAKNKHGINPKDFEDLGAPIVDTHGDSKGQKAAKTVTKDKGRRADTNSPGEPMRKLKEAFETLELDEDVTLEEALDSLDEENINDLMELQLEEVAELFGEDNIEAVIDWINENVQTVDEEDLEEEEIDEEDLDEEDLEEEEIDEEELEEEEELPVKVDMSEHVDALFNGEDLSEEFKQKATTIFESAVTSKLVEYQKELDEAFVEALEEATEELTEALEEKVEDYMKYVVEEWISENEVAIEQSLRTELTEDFIEGLRNLFIEHYIDIPEDRVDVVEELAEQVEEFKNRLNEEVAKNIELSNQLNEAKKFEVVEQLGEDLTDTQKEKLHTLTESVEFKNVQDFAAKVATLKENYFSGRKKNSNDNSRPSTLVEQDMLSVSQGDESLESYVRALDRFSH